MNIHDLKNHIKNFEYQLNSMIRNNRSTSGEFNSEFGKDGKIWVLVEICTTVTSIKDGRFDTILDDFCTFYEKGEGNIIFEKKSTITSNQILVEYHFCGKLEKFDFIPLVNYSINQWIKSLESHIRREKRDMEEMVDKQGRTFLWYKSEDGIPVLYTGKFKFKDDKEAIQFPVFSNDFRDKMLEHKRNIKYSSQTIKLLKTIHIQNKSDLLQVLDVIPTYDERYHSQLGYRNSLYLRYLKDNKRLCLCVIEYYLRDECIENHTDKKFLLEQYDDWKTEELCKSL